MSEVRYYQPVGSNRKIPYVAPSDTGGMLSERPKNPIKSVLSRGMYQDYTAIRAILQRGPQAIRAMGAQHEGTFRERVQRFVPSEKAIQQRLMQQSRKRQQEILSQGESNRVLPDRGTFSADKKRREVHASFQRGDRVVHSAGKTRLTILGPSRSKPGYYKAADLEGNTFRVHPSNLQRY